MGFGFNPSARIVIAVLCHYIIISRSNRDFCQMQCANRQFRLSQCTNRYHCFHRRATLSEHQCVNGEPGSNPAFTIRNTLRSTQRFPPEGPGSNSHKQTIRQQSYVGKCLGRRSVRPTSPYAFTLGPCSTLLMKYIDANYGTTIAVP